MASVRDAQIVDEASLGRDDVPGGTGGAQSHKRQSGEYFFKFQFYVHECQLLKDYFNIQKPAIAIRFLDFPTLIMEG
jgi:hypothetical protein